MKRSMHWSWWASVGEKAAGRQRRAEDVCGQRNEAMHWKSSTLRCQAGRGVEIGWMGGRKAVMSKRG